jgi:hypothetical protein
MWVTCTHLAASGYHAEFLKGCCQKHTNLLNCRTVISGYHVDFHEGHGTVGEWQGHDKGMAWVWHGTCELVFTVSVHRSNNKECATQLR